MADTIKSLREEIDKLKEQIRIIKCERAGIDPYKTHSAYDLSKPRIRR